MEQIDQKHLLKKKKMRARLKKESRQYVWNQCVRKVNASIRMNLDQCIYSVPDTVFGNYMYNLETGINFVSDNLKNTPNISFKFIAPNHFYINL